MIVLYLLAGVGFLYAILRQSSWWGEDRDVLGRKPGPVHDDFCECNWCMEGRPERRGEDRFKGDS